MTKVLEESIADLRESFGEEQHQNQTEEERIRSTESLKQEESEESTGTTKKNNDLKIQGHMVYEGRRKQIKSGRGKKKSSQDAEAAKGLGVMCSNHSQARGLCVDFILPDL